MTESRELNDIADLVWLEISEQKQHDIFELADLSENLTAAEEILAGWKNLGIVEWKGPNRFSLTELHQDYDITNTPIAKSTSAGELLANIDITENQKSIVRSEQRAEGIQEWGKFGGTVGGMAALAWLFFIEEWRLGDGGSSIIIAGLIGAAGAGAGAAIFSGIGAAYHQTGTVVKIALCVLISMLALIALLILNGSEEPELEVKPQFGESKEKVVRQIADFAESDSIGSKVRISDIGN